MGNIGRLTDRKEVGMREKQLILYKNVPHEDILVDMVYLYEQYMLAKEAQVPTEEDKNLMYDVISKA